MRYAFRFYAKMAPPSHARTATFDLIAESKRNLTQGSFCRFLMDYNVIPTVIEKASIADIISAAPRWIDFDDFCHRLNQVAQRAAYSLGLIEQQVEKRQLEALYQAFKAAHVTTSRDGFVSKHALTREFRSILATNDNQTLIPTDLMDEFNSLLNVRDARGVDEGLVSWKHTEKCLHGALNQQKLVREREMRAKRIEEARIKTRKAAKPGGTSVELGEQATKDKEQVKILLGFITGELSIA